MRRLLLAIACSLVSFSHAHRPLLSKPSCDGDFSAPSSALHIPDPTISWSFSHFADCTSRALWMSFTSPRDNFVFYVGSGIPTQERFADLRVDAMVVGSGFPELTSDELASLPTEVREALDASPEGPTRRGVIFRSPQDQSSCSHLGPTMRRSSTIKNDRCNFYEPFGRTNSWRVLDADGIVIPTVGETYHVAVWLQAHKSGKFGVAVGTWVENFSKRFDGYPALPGCSRNLRDFSEEHSAVDPSKFPVVECAIAQTPAPEDASLNETKNGDGGDTAGSSESDDPDDCPGGAVTDTDSVAQYMMVCGGQRCPTAAARWEAVNMRMHNGMAIRFSSHPDVDFVRGMIPHHNGAVEMCDLLLLELTCESYESVWALEGLVHLCNHVKREQLLQVGGMQTWLDAKLDSVGHDALRVGTCDGNGDHTDHDDGPTHSSRREDDDYDGHDDHGAATGHSHGGHSMSMGCGNTSSYASRALIHANTQMHSQMAVALTCSHTTDFVRQMIPHHKGAIRMCEVLLDPKSWSAGDGDNSQHRHRRDDNEAMISVGPDEYLRELCDNVTRLQRAEVVFMEKWLTARDRAVHAPCGLTAQGTCKTTGQPPFQHLATESGAPPLACEDTLSISSFCHLPNGGVNDDLCLCEQVAAAGQHSCSGPPKAVGNGSSQVLDLSVECRRFCGLCLARPPLFPMPCSGCQAGRSFPYWCERQDAEMASPLYSAHQDGTNGSSGCLWMPDGPETVHGDYAGDAAECQCHHHSMGCTPVTTTTENEGAESTDAEEANAAPRGVMGGVAVMAMCVGVCIVLNVT